MAEAAADGRPSGSEVLDTIVETFNCKIHAHNLISLSNQFKAALSNSDLPVDRDEVERLMKRFKKLDKVRHLKQPVFNAISPNTCIQDNSGTIERDEFLSLPQVSSNPLATRYVLFLFFFSISNRLPGTKQNDRHLRRRRRR